jgi:hypothetical protein
MVNSRGDRGLAVEESVVGRVVEKVQRDGVARAKTVVKDVAER